MGTKSEPAKPEPVPVQIEDSEANSERKKRAAGRKEKSVDESGGPAGPEPTRYGDWERKGIATDF